MASPLSRTIKPVPEPQDGCPRRPSAPPRALHLPRLLATLHTARDVRGDASSRPAEDRERASGQYLVPRRAQQTAHMHAA